MNVLSVLNSSSSKPASGFGKVAGGESASNGFGQVMARQMPEGFGGFLTAAKNLKGGFSEAPLAKSNEEQSFSFALDVPVQSVDLSSMTPNSPEFQKMVSDELNSLRNGNSEVSGEDVLKAIVSATIKLNGGVNTQGQSEVLPEFTGADDAHEKPESILADILASLDKGSLSLEQFTVVSQQMAAQGFQQPERFLEASLKGLGFRQEVVDGQRIINQVSKPELSVSISQPGARDNSSSENYQKALSHLSQISAKPVSFDISASVKAVFAQLDQFRSQGTPSDFIKLDGANPGVFKVDGAPTLSKPSGASEWAPVTVDRNSSTWSRDMLSALGDRLKMQVSQNVKEATVRLDPPELGRVEFSVRMDGDRVSVQINSTNAQVRDLLMQQIERLRSELDGSSNGSVDVQVGDGKSNQQGSETASSFDEGISRGQSEAPESNVQNETVPRHRAWLSTSA